MKKTKGFTLVELNIVIVIIGLIVGAVFAGSAMIRNSELQAVLVERDIYAKAVKEFMDKYQALPGDMVGAAAIWGADGTCTNAASSTPKVETCDGDGNGMIGYWRNGNGTVTLPSEWFRAWQHLSNAGFVDKKFTGVRGTVDEKQALTGFSTGGIANVATSRIENAGWTLLYVSNTDDTILYAPTSGHVFLYGIESSANYTQDPVFSPSEALSIDSKIDDGLPSLGNVRSPNLIVPVLPEPPYNNCTNASGVANNDIYLQTTTTEARCSLFFFLGF